MVVVVPNKNKLSNKHPHKLALQIKCAKRAFYLEQSNNNSNSLPMLEAGSMPILNLRRSSQLLNK